MPLGAILDERHAPAFVGSGDDRGRPSLLPRQLSEDAYQGIDVVSVDLDDLPAERTPAFCQRFEANRPLGGVTLLQPIAIDNDREIVEAEVRGRHDGLPVAAFL